MDTIEWGGKRLVRVEIQDVRRCAVCELRYALFEDCKKIRCRADEAPYFTNAVYRTAQDAATYRLTGEFPELGQDTP